MQPELIGIVWAAAWPPVWALFWRGLTRRWPVRGFAAGFWPQWLAAAFWTAVTQALVPDYPAVAIAAGSAVIALAGWWLSRRRKRRSPKLAGAKSRALLAAVVAKLRESLKPRPVLRPVPGGAR